jgi:cysteinyl-tRNA synthetase
MSKSSGNFYTIRDLFDKGYSPESVRYALLSSHYRQKLNFTFERLDSAQKAINKLQELSRRLKLISDDENKGSSEYINKTNEFISDFNRQLSDDLNISGSLGSLFIWVNFLFKLIDSKNISNEQSEDALNKLKKIDNIIGVINSSVHLDEEIKKIIENRDMARKEKNWVKSDKLRDELSSRGIIIEDTPEGQIWKLK